MTDYASLNQQEVWASLPEEWPLDPLPHIRQQVAASRRKIVVLDDDPTGTQTVHDIPVLTEWSVDSLTQELANDAVPAFYILTNSRSMTLEEAQALNVEIGRNLIEAAQRAQTEYAIVSRSDSTLRGHFPGELDALESIGPKYDAWLIIPFFEEGGRFTINDVHYVAEGDLLVPAGQTPFARDKVFGYQASNLRAWVEEKTRGRISQEDVASISLEQVRREGADVVAKQLLALSQGAVCVVNAASYRDLEVFVDGLLEAESQGRRYLYRTAASFVRVRAGLSSRPLLTREELVAQQTGSGGLMVVGSYVPRTSAQVNALLDATDVQPLEVNVADLLDDHKQWSTIENIAREADIAMARGQDVVVFTSRELVTGQDATANLAIGNRISDSLVRIVRSIETRPSYLLAKGGITSSDIATKALGIKRAMVLGQILPGVPVWQAGAESRYPGMSYIVFPGNVGGTDALVQSLGRLRRPQAFSGK